MGFQYSTLAFGKLRYDSLLKHCKQHLLGILEFIFVWMEYDLTNIGIEKLTKALIETFTKNYIILGLGV